MHTSPCYKWYTVLVVWPFLLLFDDLGVSLVDISGLGVSLVDISGKSELCLSPSALIWMKNTDVRAVSTA